MLKDFLVSSRSFGQYVQQWQDSSYKEHKRTNKGGQLLLSVMVWCSGSPVAPARWEMLEEVLSRVREVCWDFPCLFPSCRSVQVLESRQECTSYFVLQCPLSAAVLVTVIIFYWWNVTVPILTCCVLLERRLVIHWLMNRELGDFLMEKNIFVLFWLQCTKNLAVHQVC